LDDERKKKNCQRGGREKGKTEGLHPKRLEVGRDLSKVKGHGPPRDSQKRNGKGTEENSEGGKLGQREVAVGDIPEEARKARGGSEECGREVGNGLLKVTKKADIFTEQTVVYKWVLGLWFVKGQSRQLRRKTNRRMKSKGIHNSPQGGTKRGESHQR